MYIFALVILSRFLKSVNVFLIYPPGMNSANSQHDSLTILVKSGLNLAGEDVLHQAPALLLWDSPINYDANEEHITEREEMLNISLMETF